ncbi:hypothetical protein LTR94_030797, partial [Friedmanniomyces endolithicus]
GRRAWSRSPAWRVPAPSEGGSHEDRHQPQLSGPVPRGAGVLRPRAGRQGHGRLSVRRGPARHAGRSQIQGLADARLAGDRGSGDHGGRPAARVRAEHRQAQERLRRVVSHRRPRQGATGLRRPVRRRQDVDALRRNLLVARFRQLHRQVRHPLDGQHQPDGGLETRRL